MPTTEKKITTFGQVVFIGFAITVDVTEFLLDIVAVGLIVNRIIDAIVACIFFLYASWKGLTIAEDSKVYNSIVGTAAGEFIPGLDIAPFFTIDAWYITHSIKEKDKAHQAVLDEETKAAVAEQNRQDWVENYEQQQAMQAQEEGAEVSMQGEPTQKTIEQEANYKNSGGVGRIKPLKIKEDTKPQLTGKPVGNSGIIK
jgi:hypothetical protein